MKARSLPCSGRLEPQHLLAAIEQGARRVVVVGCPKGRCRYIDGNQRAQKRVRFVQGLIEQIGLGAERIIWIEGPLEYEGDMESLARELGILNSTG
jgi:coenzyme F420-reducing hydrogenase delta subunit